MNVRSYCSRWTLTVLMLGITTAGADTIDPNKPISESLKPDILYFNFDEEIGAPLPSLAEQPLTASMEPGKVEATPAWKPGRNALFGKALEFHYGAHPPFPGVNERTAGNHLLVPNHPAVQLTGQSFTLGAWVQIPENAEVPANAYKKLMGKGAYSQDYPGWAFQISMRDGGWAMTFLTASMDATLARFAAPLPAGLQPGVWHHLAVSYNKEAGKIVFWFDGTAISTQNLTEDIGESEAPLFIGENGMSLYSNTPLLMDEVFITSGAHDFDPVAP